MKKFQVNHLNIAIIISASLVLLTIIAISLTGDWSVRHVYNVFYFGFLSFTILSFNALIFSKERRFLTYKLRKFLRISFIVLYSFAYILAVLSFWSTGQIIRLQTVLFLSNMTPFSTAIAISVFSVVAILLFIVLIHKKSTVKDSQEKERKGLQFFLFANLTLFIITILVNTFLLRIENPIISDEKQLILYQSEDPVLREKLFNTTDQFDKPNVVFILLESLSAERIGFYGYPRDVTPNIDNLAQKSIVFTKAYTTATHSDYAQNGLLSSRYLYINKLRNLFTDNNPKKFIWDIFKEDNYTTGYFSSQDDRWKNMNQYLDYSNLDDYSNSTTDGKTDYGTGFASKDYDHRTSAKAIAWLDKISVKKNSFFLYLNFQATHNPLVYPEEYARYKPDTGKVPLVPLRGEVVSNRYDNALGYVDAQVGKIINYLKKNNLIKNTIIVITSDHGHDLENKHGIFGHGKSIYNEELIVPAIVFLPGVKPMLINEKVSHIDFVPTLIDLLGYPIPKEFQGDIMRKNRPIYFVAQSHKYMIGMIQGNIKVILDMNRKLVEIYDLENDPEELRKLNPNDYSDSILKLLFWNYCQKNYYKNKKWETGSYDRCSLNNNFKI